MSGNEALNQEPVASAVATLRRVVEGIDGREPRERFIQDVVATLRRPTPNPYHGGDR